MSVQTVKPSAEALKKPYLLIDTANDTLSLAVMSNGVIHAEFSEAVYRDMAARLQPEMLNVLQSAQMQWSEVEAVLFNEGPGSFTSIRIGLAAAKALELSLGLKLCGLNGMQALAEPHFNQGKPVLVVLQAVGQDVYSQAFAEDGTPLSEPVAQPLPETLAAAPAGALIVGDMPEAHVQKNTATANSFWQLFAGGHATTPPKPAYVRPLTYKKVAAQG